MARTSADRNSLRKSERAVGARFMAFSPKKRFDAVAQHEADDRKDHQALKLYEREITGRIGPLASGELGRLVAPAQRRIDQRLEQREFDKPRHQEHKRAYEPIK